MKPVSAVIVLSFSKVIDLLFVLDVIRKRLRVMKQDLVFETLKTLLNLLLSFRTIAIRM